MKISPVTGALGATVDGVDLSALDDAGFAAVETALAAHLALYFPDQSLDRHQLAALGRRFGPPFLHPLVDNGFADEPSVLEIVREPDDRAMFGGESWHVDVSWLDRVGTVSILHAKELPPVGGDTGFASSIAAFEALSEGMKATLRTLKAVHAYHLYEGREDPDYSAVQPVVRKCPDGREALYLTSMFNQRFEGMTPAESAPLLNFLFAHQIRHEFTCRFRWTQGGVLMWDNRTTLHYPINDFTGHRRRMIRTTSLER